MWVVMADINFGSCISFDSKIKAKINYDQRDMPSWVMPKCMYDSVPYCTCHQNLPREISSESRFLDFDLIGKYNV